MSTKGFGKRQPAKADKLVEQVVRHCHRRRPEELDKIFDNLSAGLTPADYQRLNQQVLYGALAALAEDIDTLSWFCSYFSGEVNRSEDNDKPHPIATLSRMLMVAGMQSFADFMPYPGRRLVIINTDKFNSLPEGIRAKIQQAFALMEATSEEAQQMNEALLSELAVQE